MKYLIDANVFEKKAFNIAYPIVAGHNDHERGLTLSGIAQLLNEMQPVDAVPVIRCRDCKHRLHNGTCIKNMKRKPDDGFCDEGEVKQY